LSFGLANQHQPVDPVELEKLERKFQKFAGPPPDRL
jgi:hypothetical protein